MTKEDDRTAARDFVMARLAACHSAMAQALASLDEALAHFVDPDDDQKGKNRGELLEVIDAQLGDAARAVQLAQGEWENVDPKEGEQEADDDDDEDDENDDDDDEDE